MKEKIAYCGLNCAVCDAYLATVYDDGALREKTAKLWSELNRVPITPDMIRCMGCRGDGVKTPYCRSMCPIRKCATEKGLAGCGQCAHRDECQIQKPITDNR